MISVLIGGLIAVLFVAVATSGTVELFAGPPTFMDTTDEARPPATIPTEAEEEVLDEAVGTPFELPQFVEVIVRMLFFVTMAVATALIAIFVWRHRPRLSWKRRRHRSTDFDTIDSIAATIAADAEAQRAALRHGTPRNAIVECWLRLEAAVVAAGVRRDPADTAEELTHRVLANAHVDSSAIDRLASLYREARFSTHTMDEDDRRAAIAALDTVHDGLAASAKAGVGTGIGTELAPR